MLSPVVARAPIAAILFTSLGKAKRTLEEVPNININLKHFLSGFFAGFCYTQVAFFFDLLKTRAQGSVNKTMSYRQEISTIYKNEGMIGFTRGYTGMLMRDSPGFGVYFCTFEFLKRLMNLPEREK